MLSTRVFGLACAVAVFVCLVAAPVSAQLLDTPALFTFSGAGTLPNNDRSGAKRTCPQCRGLMEYRHQCPILSAVDPNPREPGERLRYVSAWFCIDSTCEYQD